MTTAHTFDQRRAMAARSIGLAVNGYRTATSRVGADAADR